MPANLMNLLKSGVDQNEPIFIKNFPIKSLSLSKKAVKNTYYLDIKRGKTSKTNGPINIMYNIESGQFIVTDGYHRVIETMLNNKKYIDAEVWSTKYSDYYAIVKDYWFIPKPLPNIEINQ